MTRAREQIISLDATPYYHCISRCVRRAFLCGEDSLTGKSYEHRKAWVVERLGQLVGTFAIDVCAYAVMSNHYHLVLRVDRELSASWTNAQVIERWEKLYNLPLLVARYTRGEPQSQAEVDEVHAIVGLWRQRLTDISWFMRSLNEHLARRGNEEVNCTGRFWEGRFKSQALLDEGAVLTCMSYVDLNPIRAGLADTPEASDFTSIQQRIHQYAKHTADSDTATPTETAVPLMPLVSKKNNRHPNAISFSAADYIELVDWAGRLVLEGKRGAISGSTPPILQRLGLAPARYLEHLGGAASAEAPTVLGRLPRIREVAQLFERCFIKGVGESRRLYSHSV